MQQNVDKVRKSPREWLDEARFAQTMAEGAFCYRKARLALDPKMPPVGAAAQHSGKD